MELRNDDAREWIARAERNWIKACALYGEDHPISKAYLKDLENRENADRILKELED